MKKNKEIIAYALEKQIPRKPIGKRYMDYDDLKNVLIGKCPSCRWEVAHFENYCGNCGQRLNWDTTKTNTLDNKLYWE
jgi:predicted amidophosphoribosyltransferase